MVKICNKTYSDDKTHQPHFDVFDFPLSDFQKYAIEAIVTGNDTFLFNSKACHSSTALASE